MSYCTAIEQMSGERKLLHKNYHDKLYGFPIHDDNELFCRLVMEINQAGLSWETILKKEASFRKAYHNFNIKKVAGYTESDRERLMADPGIIRNRLKINAAIENAKTILLLQKEHGSFEKWLEHHHPKTKAEWIKLFKTTFKFTGGEIVNEFLMSIGYLPGAHDEDCRIYKQLLKKKPMWQVAGVIKEPKINWQPADLEDEIVSLKPLQEKDFAALFKLGSDPLIWEQHPASDRYKKEVFQAFFDGAISSKTAFVIRVKVSGKIIGSTRYYDYIPEESSIAIGFTFFSRKYWGGKANKSVKKLMLDYAFQYVDHVMFHIGANNIRSQTATMRFGAVKTGEQVMDGTMHYVYVIKKAGSGN